MAIIGRAVLSALLTYAIWVVYDTNIWVLTDEHAFAFLLSSFFLAIHEAGHMLFLLPEFFMGNIEPAHFLYVAGGSLFQWFLPLGIGYYFFHKRQYFELAVCIFLFGFSLHASVLYIGDAMALKLPLLGGQDAGAHDWNYLLHHMGVLYRAPEIAKSFEHVSKLIMLGSVIYCWINTVLLMLENAEDS